MKNCSPKKLNKQENLLKIEKQAVGKDNLKINLTKNLKSNQIKEIVLGESEAYLRQSVS